MTKSPLPVSVVQDLTQSRPVEVAASVTRADAKVGTTVAAEISLNAPDLVCSNDDFTIYVKCSSCELEFEKGKKEHEGKSSIDATIRIRGAIPSASAGKTDFSVSGRALVAKCYKGEFYSISVRANKKGIEVAHRANLEADKSFKTNISHDGRADGDATRNREFAAALDLLPKSVPADTMDDIKKYFYGQDVVANSLAEVVFPSNAVQSGLIVLAGTTGCGKTDLSAGLIWTYLQKIPWGSERRPHLITIEDPIENIAREAPVGFYNRSAGWDYTPRHLGVDVVNLRQAILDAKRMKPAIVLVGETREASDWKLLMEFAGSGHLVITTTHASSLVETIQRIFKAVDATTPTLRGAAARSILAAIHLESLKVDRGDGTLVSGIVPAVWKSSTSGSLGLVSDGLASILPGNPRGNARKESSLGRFWFAQRIEREFMKVTRHDPLPQHYKQPWKDFKSSAAARDLVTL